MLIIIMTTIAGKALRGDLDLRNVDLRIRPGSRADAASELRDDEEGALRSLDRVAHFRPEFLNRLDDVISSVSLNKENLKTIVDIELSKVRGRMADRGLELVLSDEAKDYLISKGFNPDYGARPLRRSIENYIEDPLCAEEILRGTFKGRA